MTAWSFDQLRSVTGAAWAARPVPGTPQACDGISTDTRTLRAGEAFVAIRGERTDGHLHLADARRAGSPLAFIDRAFDGPIPPGLAALRVADTRRGLLRIAAAHRASLDGTRVIAVTGSNGKTTTTRMIDAVLRGSLRGTASHKSYNNHVGLSLTLLAARPGDQYLACEIGTNAPGEVAELARAAAPDVAVVTSIGREHLEKLRSLRQVAQEEASHVEFLRPGGLAVVNADAPHLRDLVESRSDGGRAFSIISFGSGRDADLRVQDVRQDASGVSFTINGRFAYRVPLLGTHNAFNAAAAVAVARRLGVDHDAIAAALAGVRGASMRLEAISVEGVRIINDAYNANPDSMAAALETFTAASSGAGRRVAVLGDMLELGEHAASAHAEVVARALDPGARIDRLVLVGPLMASASRGVDDDRVVVVPEATDRAIARIAEALRPGDAVLLKGSRRMRIERVAEALVSRPKRSPARARGRRAPTRSR